MDAIRRMSTPGRPWCVTTSPLWGEVMPSKSRTRLPSCVILRMSGISGTNVDTNIRPEIGPSCVTCSSNDSDQISESQEGQSTLMTISQGQRLVWDYASQFETLLGRLDSYDESMMLNQFIWGLQPELARSVSLQYPKSIAQAVSLAETTELAVKASRRPVGKSGSSGTNQSRGPSQSSSGPRTMARWKYAWSRTRQWNESGNVQWERAKFWWSRTWIRWI